MMGTRYMDKRYDEVAEWQAKAWKIKEELGIDNVEETNEWKYGRAVADQIAAEQQAIKEAELAAKKAAKAAEKASGS